MKKQIGVILFLGLLVLSMNFSSAGWFSNSWNKITGNAVREGDYSSESYNAYFLTSKLTLTDSYQTLDSNTDESRDSFSMDIDKVELVSDGVERTCSVYYYYTYVDGSKSKVASTSFTKKISTRTLNHNSNKLVNSISIKTTKTCSDKIKLTRVSLIGKLAIKSEEQYDEGFELGSGREKKIKDYGYYSLDLNGKGIVNITSLNITAKKISGSDKCVIYGKYVYLDGTSSSSMNSLRSFSALDLNTKTKVYKSAKNKGVKEIIFYTKNEEIKTPGRAVGRASKCIDNLQLSGVKIIGSNDEALFNNPNVNIMLRGGRNVLETDPSSYLEYDLNEPMIPAYVSVTAKKTSGSGNCPIYYNYVYTNDKLSPRYSLGVYDSTLKTKVNANNNPYNLNIIKSVRLYTSSSPGCVDNVQVNDVEVGGFSSA